MTSSPTSVSVAVPRYPAPSAPVGLRPQLPLASPLASRSTPLAAMGADLGQLWLVPTPVAASAVLPHLPTPQPVATRSRALVAAASGPPVFVLQAPPRRGGTLFTRIVGQVARVEAAAAAALAEQIAAIHANEEARGVDRARVQRFGDGSWPAVPLPSYVPSYAAAAGQTPPPGLPGSPSDGPGNGGPADPDALLAAAEAPVLLAASYARKSDPNDQGIETQHAYNAARAAADGYLIPPEWRFSDDDTPGITVVRPGLDALMAVVADGDAPFSRVYIQDNTRLGRWADHRRRGAVELYFEDRGVKIRFSNQRDQPEDLADATNAAVVGYVVTQTVEGIGNHREYRLTRERTARVRRQMFADGKYPGPGGTPYAVERVLVDAVTGAIRRRLPQRGRYTEPGTVIRLAWTEGGERAVVRSVYEDLARGESLRGVAARLNAAGEPPPGARLGPPPPGHVRRWTPETIRDLAINPVYRGEVVLGRTTAPGGRNAHKAARRAAAVKHGRPASEGGKRGWPKRDRRRTRPPQLRPAPATPLTPEEAMRDLDKPGPIGHRGYLTDPPVPDELWHAVQRVLARRRERAGAGRPSSAFPLRGLVKCAACGATWHGHTSMGRPRRDASGAPGPRPRTRYYLHHKRDLVKARREQVDGADAWTECEHAGRHLAAEGVEAAAIAAARGALAGPAYADDVGAELDRRLAAASGAEDAAEEEVRLVRAQEEAGRALARAVAAYADETDPDVLVSAAAEKQNRAGQLRAARARLTAFREGVGVLAAARARAAEHYAAAPDLVAAFDTSGAAQRQRLLELVLLEVRVHWDARPDGHAVDVHVRAVPARGAAALWAA